MLHNINIPRSPQFACPQTSQKSLWNSDFSTDTILHSHSHTHACKRMLVLRCSIPASGQKFLTSLAIYGKRPNVFLVSIEMERTASKRMAVNLSLKVVHYMKIDWVRHTYSGRIESLDNLLADILMGGSFVGHRESLRHFRPLSVSPFRMVELLMLLSSAWRMVLTAAAADDGVRCDFYKIDIPWQIDVHHFLWPEHNLNTPTHPHTHTAITLSFIVITDLFRSLFFLSFSSSTQLQHCLFGAYVRHSDGCDAGVLQPNGTRIVGEQIDWRELATPNRISQIEEEGQ